MGARIGLVGCLFALIAASGCGDDDSTRPRTPGAVEGHIQDYLTGSPVSDAAVILVDPGTLSARSDLTPTDAEGFYRIETETPGRYSLFLYHDSLVVHATTADYIEIARGRTTVHDLELQSSELWGRDGIRIEGRIVSAKSGSPVSGAYVEEMVWGWQTTDLVALFLGIPVPGLGISDADGRFSIDATFVGSPEGGRAGLLPIGITRSGYQPSMLVGRGPDLEGVGPLLPLPASGDSTLLVEIRLQELHEPDTKKEGAVRGRVVHFGVPVADMPVALSLFYVPNPDTLDTPVPLAIPLPDRTARSGADGAFLIERVPPGEYAIAVGYLLDDRGAMPSWLSSSEIATQVEVAADEVTEAGEVQVAKVLEPLDPPRGGETRDQTPLLTWSTVESTDAYEVIGYDVWYSTGYILNGPTRVAAAEYQVPPQVAFPPGTRVRWLVDAVATTREGDETVVVAGFERSSTFEIIE